MIAFRKYVIVTLMSEVDSRKYRSTCPMNFALETFGDSWSLLIIRDIAFWGKRTFGEFLRSKEGIATNILSSRLLMLEKEGILTKTPNSDDKRKDDYSLTQKGLDLIPIMLELGAWSSIYDDRQPGEFKQFVKKVRSNQAEMTEQFKELVRSGGSIFSESLGRQTDCG